MERSEASHANIPVTGIHPNDLKVLENVLKMYLLYLRRSHSGNTGIERTQRLHRRLQQMLALPQGIEGACILFTAQELRTVTEALSSYMTMLCEIITPSPQRAEVLAALQGLQQQFATMLSAYLN
jgi:hypothetical protein